MHSRDAPAAGESEQQLYALSVWHETLFFTERGRAALAGTEALTRVSEGPISDDLFEKTRIYFSEEGLLALPWAIIELNGWNRLAKAFRNVLGTYKTQVSVTHSDSAIGGTGE